MRPILSGRADEVEIEFDLGEKKGSAIITGPLLFQLLASPDPRHIEDRSIMPRIID